jgi:histidinol-phosphate aminotransferase
MTSHQQPQPSGAQPAYPRGPERAQSADAVYKMSSNENPLGCSPAAAAAVQAAAAGLGDYPPFTDDKLRAALADLHGRGLTPDHFVTGNGGCDVLELIARSLLSPGDEVIICPPTFPVYAVTAKAEGASVVHVDLAPGTFAYRVDAMLEAVTHRTRLLYLCSPNNPTGNLLAQDQMDQIMAALPERAVIVFDEVYYHFVTQPDRPNPIDYVLRDANIVALHSFSKAYGLAGLRLGYCVAKPELAQTISALRRPFHINTLCFEAGMAALTDAAHVERTVEVTLAGRDWLIGQIRELGLDAWPSESNFVLFRCPVPAAEWAQKLELHNILVRPAFGLPDCLRVTVGLPEANRVFIDVLAELAT